MSKIKTERFYREAVVELIGRENDDRRIEVAFSSEEPVERHFGQEVLDHAPESIRLGRLTNTGVLLVNHDPSDLVGKVEEVTLGSDRIGRATVRFGNSARAQEIYQDVQDGIRSGVSVGYQIHKLEEEKDEDVSIFRATDWEPMEISLVSIPADSSVGVGRSDEEPIETEIKYLTRSNDMSEETKVVQPEAPKVDIEAVKSEARNAEVQRIQEITAIGTQFDKSDLARQMIESNGTVDAMRKSVLDALPQQKPVAQSAPDKLHCAPLVRFECRNRILPPCLTSRSGCKSQVICAWLLRLTKLNPVTSAGFAINPSIV